MTELSLRPVAEADLELFYADQADPESARLAAFASRDRPEFLAHWERLLANDEVLVRTIEHDGEPVGHVETFVRDLGRELGYWITRPHWGRGIATNAVGVFLADHEPRRPLSAGVARHNEASRRVLERNGFVGAGVEQATLDDGSTVELLVFRLD